SAEKLNRRPPLTTLAQRLMSTTRSTSSRSFGLIGVVRTQYLDGPVRQRRRGGSPRLEPQPGFAGAVGHRSHTSVINEPVAIEHDLFDLVLQAFAGNQLTHLPRRAGLVELAERLTELRRKRRRRCEGAAADVVHHLRVDVIQAAVHGQPRTLRGALNLLADARLALQPRFESRRPHGWCSWRSAGAGRRDRVRTRQRRSCPACGGWFPRRTSRPCPCTAPERAARGSPRPFDPGGPCRPHAG